MSLILQGEGKDRGEQHQAAHDFVRQLAKCSGLKLKLGADGSVSVEGKDANPPPGSDAIAGPLKDLINSDKKLVLKVRRKAQPGDSVVDKYCDRRAILDHIDAFPENPPDGFPSATTRCEVVAHFMAEYADALSDGDDTCYHGFDKHHGAGVAAQKKYRDARGQKNAPPHANVEKDGIIEFQHCDGSKTLVKQNPDTGGITVEHTKAPEKEQKPTEKGTKNETPPPAAGGDTTPKSLLPSFEDLMPRHPVAFIGTIEDVGSRPGMWTDFATAHQPVRYRVETFLKGGLPVGPALVHHLCMQGSLTADLSRPGLSPDLFTPGRRLVVFARFAVDPDRKGGFRLESNDPDAYMEAESPPGTGVHETHGSYNG